MSSNGAGLSRLCPTPIFASNTGTLDLKFNALNSVWTFRFYDDPWRRMKSQFWLI